ncbi:DUF58 domain-containing protein [Shimia marina]|uniref:DUF58 domain-containing protein n=1 Tax=Shimia marina TaxID=321267 RepID=A0A0P1ELI9_9RHOB|nr:DUF58 domain-containing protein [Shimia marina]CUH51183.1 hypothetical protein SHM7688_00617 [Shimia marina]SFD55745.1 Protein of unknown function DUF58 [Shimia marina]
MSSAALHLRSRAEAEAARLPPLLAQAEHLAGTVLLGEHGRRRAGMGDDFWQYRPVMPGDSLRMIDWRRSAKSDAQFVRQREWQVAQSVMMWVDTASSMHFSGDAALPSKADRARVLAMALAILLIRSGERVGLTGTDLPPRRGEAQILRLAEMFLRDAPEGEALDDGAPDYGVPEARAMLPHARAVFMSDFMGDFEAVTAALTKAADRGVRGLCLQVLDPVEEAFPFKGRAIFESMGGTLRHDTKKADDLKTRYLERLAERRAQLKDLCRATGWLFGHHSTSQSAQSALLWAHRALGHSA